ncbi:MAG: ComEC/Rec2 family competence protein, partial [Clostridia bacterium]
MDQISVSQTRKGKTSMGIVQFFVRRRLLCVVLCYMAGILLSKHTPFSLWMIGACMCATGLLILVKSRQIGICLLACCIGISCASAWRTPPAGLLEGTYTVRGQIESAVQVEANRVRFDLARLSIQTGDTWRPMSGKFAVYAQDAPVLRYGQQVEMTGNVRIPRDASNPGGLDMRMWLAQRGVHAMLLTPEVTALQA